MIYRNVAYYALVVCLIGPVAYGLAGLIEDATLGFWPTVIISAAALSALYILTVYVIAHATKHDNSEDTPPVKGHTR